MEKSDPLEITQVNNGFIVTPVKEIRNNCIVANNSINVFQTMTALQGFIENHFSDDEGKDHG